MTHDETHRERPESRAQSGIRQKSAKNKGLRDASPRNQVAEKEGFEPCGNDAFGEVSPQSFPVDFPSGYKKIVPRRHKARGVFAK